MPKSHEHSISNERGMSLIEVLVGVAIASLVLAACYGSYVVVTGYYRTQNDLSNVRQTVRQALETLGRDIRMAGFVYLETAGGSITEPLSTTNGGAAGCPGCDTLKLVFDKCTQAGAGMSAICNDPSQFARRMVVYEVKQCPTGSPITRTTRLCRTVYECPAGRSCGNTNMNSGWICPQGTACSGSPIADNVDDLQFALKTSESLALPPGNGASAHSIDIGLIMVTKGEHGNARQFALPGNWPTNFQSPYRPPTDRFIRDWGMISIMLRNNAYAQG